MTNRHMPKTGKKEKGTMTYSETTSVPVYRTYIWENMEARENGDTWLFMLDTDDGYSYTVRDSGDFFAEWVPDERDPDPDDPKTIAALVALKEGDEQ